MVGRGTCMMCPAELERESVGAWESRDGSDVLIDSNRSRCCLAKWMPL